MMKTISISLLLTMFGGAAMAGNCGSYSNTASDGSLCGLRSEDSRVMPLGAGSGVTSSGGATTAQIEAIDWTMCFPTALEKFMTGVNEYNHYPTPEEFAPIVLMYDQKPVTGEWCGRLWTEALLIVKAAK